MQTDAAQPVNAGHLPVELTREAFRVEWAAVRVGEHEVDVAVAGAHEQTVSGLRLAVGPQDRQRRGIELGFFVS